MQFWSALFGRLFGRVPCVRQRVIVNLTTGDAIDGVLFQQTGAWLVLKRASLIVKDGTRKVDVDGDVVVECARIEFIQVCAAC